MPVLHSQCIRPTFAKPRWREKAERACAERLARAKALAVSQRRPNDLVLGADTVVVVGSEILGKPRDEADAIRMLQLLSGRTHQVTTGVCLIGPELRTENSKLTNWV